MTNADEKKPENWDNRKYHGRYNKWPFIEVVSFVMRHFGSVPDRSTVKILDLGCGGAHHLLFLAREGFNYYGVDGAPESIQIARAALEDNGFEPRNLECACFDKLPYADDTFDAVIDRGALVCNTLADLPPLIEEARRVLKPGGLMFSSILNVNSTHQLKARALGNNDYTDFPGRLTGAGVLHFTSAEEARQLFSKFTIKDIELTLRKSEFEGSANPDTVAWTHVTCAK